MFRIDLRDPERRIAIGYAPPAARAGLTTLFALDERLAAIVARTTEPMIGLMRLVWWRDALDGLAGGAPPAEPLLVALKSLVAAGMLAADLAAMVEGWEALIDDPDLSPETIARHADARGAVLFCLAGRLLGSDDVTMLAMAGNGWARVDLARHVADESVRRQIVATARAPLEKAMAHRWPRQLRPIGQFAALAMTDVRRGTGRWAAPATPGRLLRILRYQLVGR